MAPPNHLVAGALGGTCQVWGPTLIWVSELVKCDKCYGGNAPTGKVFAYDITSASVSEVRLPDLLAPLARESLSSGV